MIVVPVERGDFPSHPARKDWMDVRQSFGYDHLSQIIEEIKAAGYRFGRFDRPPDEGKLFYLRWDVDISPAGALEAGRLLHQQEVVSHFFFQLNAETYSAFTPLVLDGIDELRAQGHAVGLHIDQDLLGEDEDILTRTLDWFGHCCRRVDRVISFHRPTPAVIGRRYQGFFNSYAPEFFSPDTYLSDSRRSLEFRPRLTEWLQAGRSPLQLLLHPEWWEPFASAEAVLDNLQARRAAELEAYVRKAFSKVFTPILDARRQEVG